MQLRKKARLRPEISPKYLSNLGPNPTRKAEPDYNPVLMSVIEYRPTLCIFQLAWVCDRCSNQANKNRLSSIFSAYLNFWRCVQWRAVRLLVGEAQFFFTHMFAKKLFQTINDKQIIVFIATKPGLPNPWPLGHIWPVKLFCVARKVVLRGWFPHGKAYLAFSGK